LNKITWSYIEIFQATLLIIILNSFPLLILESNNNNQNLIENFFVKSLVLFLSIFLSIFLSKKFKIPYKYSISLVILVVIYTAMELSTLSSEKNSTLFYSIFSGTLITILSLALTHGKYNISLKYFGFIKTKNIQLFGLAIMVWIICILIISFWTYFIIEYGEKLNLDILIPPENAKDLLKETGNNILFMLVIASIIAPISEEIFFRFFVFLGLKNLFPNNKNMIAAIISSVFFALIHIEPGSYLVTFILGLGFCWLYIRTKNILIPIFTHSLHNTISVIMVIQL